MIVARLMGGLGNQMFQYAAGKALALRNRTELKLDLAYLDARADEPPRRRYELHWFEIRPAAASANDLRWVRGGPPAGAAARARDLAMTILKPGRLTLIEESGTGVDERVLRAGDNAYLVGFWQSERYFEDRADEIRTDFTFASEPVGENADLADAIRATPSVALHVRRGDYVTDPQTNRFHGVLPLDYYERAVAALASRVADPRFFVFSDDPEWAKANVKTGHETTFVDVNGPDQAGKDLRLLSLCRHHVVANSSFSWWGAWLARGEDKLVVAPARWFQTVEKPNLVPSSWLRL